MSVYLAYDGSINGDWIARYAIRLAAHHRERALHLVTVDDAPGLRDERRARLDRIEAECRSAGVSPHTAILSAEKGVFAALVGHIPDGPDTYLVCGARVRGGGRGFLSGTISERLLRHQRFNVLAVRVVQPGLLGMPRDLLVPLSRDPAGLRLALPFLRLFAPDVRRVHLLRVMTVGRLAYRRIEAGRVSRLRRKGWDFLRPVEAELAADLGLDKRAIDASVAVSDDWAKEVVICAGRHKSGLVYMEAPRRSLTGRFLFGDPLEQVLRSAPCDVAVYRGLA